MYSDGLLRKDYITYNISLSAHFVTQRLVISAKVLSHPSPSDDFGPEPTYSQGAILKSSNMRVERC